MKHKGADKVMQYHRPGTANSSTSLLCEFVTNCVLLEQLCFNTMAVTDVLVYPLLG